MQNKDEFVSDETHCKLNRKNRMLPEIYTKITRKVKDTKKIAIHAVISIYKYIYSIYIHICNFIIKS